LQGVVTLAWVGSMFYVAYDVENTTEDRLLIGVVVTVVAGLLSGRWWMLLVPPAFCVLLAAWAAITWSSQDTSFEEMAAALVLFALTGTALVALGVAARRIAAWAWRRATSGPDTPDTTRSPSPP
jgi:hypothetical protein